MQRLVLMACSLIILGAAVSSAQQPAEPASFEQAVFNTWRGLHNKILTMAKDAEFPDAKLGWKPHPDSRSLLEEYRHVTIGLEMSSAQLRGEKFDYEARVKADEGKPSTRASVVAEMEAAIAVSYPLVQAKANPSLIFWIDHQAEHYGKLVSNYRMNNVVPPVSRPRGRGRGRSLS